jgi:penicillin G amidase
MGAIWSELLMALLSVLVVSFSFVYQMNQPLRNAEITFKRLDGNASIVYDELGIPRIQASNINAGSFALGFAHSNDRLWQMHTLRMLAQGRLSEMYGNKTVGLDKALRLLNLKNACVEILQNYDKQIISYLESYSDGVNEFVKRKALPLQFYLISADFEPWTPRDSCVIIQLIHFQLSYNWHLELTRDYLSALVQDEEIIDMILPYHHEHLDELAKFSITDQELKKLGLFEDNRNEKYKPRRKAKIQHYIDQPEEIQNFDEDDAANYGIDGKNWTFPQP